MKSSRIFLLADGIHRKISGGHFGEKFIFVVDNHLKLTDQTAYLLGENAQLILGSIGNLYVKISLRHFECGRLDLGNRRFNQAYDHEGEEYAHQDDGNDHCRHKDHGGSVEEEAFLCRRVAALRVIGDNIIKGAV